MTRAFNHTRETKHATDMQEAFPRIEETNHAIDLHKPLDRIEEMNHAIEIQMIEFGRFWRLYPLSIRREASDPRDSIFGMLGMFPTVLSAENDPDYNKSTAVVYSEATRRTMESLVLYTLCNLRSCQKLEKVCIFHRGCSIGACMKHLFSDLWTHTAPVGPF